MFAVAIDGPSGVGKSTVSRAAAEKLGFIYVDTGALYRTLALFLIEHEVDIGDEAAVKAVLPAIKIEMRYTEAGQRMLLCGKDVTDKIRTEVVSRAASVTSAIPAVRAFLLHLQTEMAQRYNIIMDGRDIGTVVLPHAQVKIFLTAKAEERARRRCEQLKAAGTDADYAAVLKDIQERDYRDTHRETAPLKPAPDAVIVDSTENEMADTVDTIVDIIRKRYT